jgi:hypothetical protein
MIATGFYYRGIRDVVTCFRCGITLEDWKKKDDPLIRHASASPRCSHVRNQIRQQLDHALEIAPKGYSAELETATRGIEKVINIIMTEGKKVESRYLMRKGTTGPPIIEKCTCSTCTGAEKHFLKNTQSSKS